MSEYLGSRKVRDIETLPDMEVNIPWIVVDKWGIEEGSHLVFLEENGEIKIKVIG